MYRVIIADDDFLVRTYLKQMIDWQAAGCLIAGEAKNGKEALALAREVKPALVITDICMPVMDGIELIKALRAENLAPHILVLSCHDDFHYVREAMLLGIDDYLLKDNLTPENILGYLAKHLGANASAAPNNDTNLVVTDELAKIGQEKLRADFLAAFTRGELTADDVSVSAQRVGIVASALAVGMRIDLRGYRARRSALTATDYAALRQALQEILVTAIARRGLQASAYPLAVDAERGILGIILASPSVTSSASIAKTSQELASHLQVVISRYLNLDTVIVMTSPQTGLARLMPVWSRLARTEATFYLTAGVYQERDLPETSEVVATVPLAGLVDYIREQRVAATARRTLAHDAGAPAELIARLAEAESYAEYAAIMADHLAATSARADYHPSIARAIELIDEHYSEPITQPDIAAAVHLNAAYFSTLFKKNVGQGFRDYLAERRIEAVKRELKTSTARIKDIAAAAGFEDYPYFCRLFKQLTGLTAQEYRLAALTD